MSETTMEKSRQKSSQIFSHSISIENITQISKLCIYYLESQKWERILNFGKVDNILSKCQKFWNGFGIAF